MKDSILAACRLQIEISNPREKQYLIQLEYEGKSLADFRNKLSPPLYLISYLEDLYLYGKMESITKKERSKDERLSEFSQIDLDFNSLSELLFQLRRFISTSKLHEISSTVGASSRTKILFSDSIINQRLNQTLIDFLKEEILLIYNKYASKSDRIPSHEELELIEIVDHLIDIQNIRQQEIMGKRKSLKPKDVSLGYFHLIMHKIILLCKWEKRKLNQSKAPIDDTSLNAAEYKFIYSYLEYFDLLEYDKQLYTTTQPERYIRTMFSKFPISTHPDFWDEIEEIINSIRCLE